MSAFLVVAKQFHRRASRHLTHVKRYHEMELEKDTPGTSSANGGPPPKKQATLEHILEKSVMYDTDDPRAKAITQTIAEQMCVDMEPFDLVNKLGFQHTIKQFCPKYKMVSRPHISENVIPDMYCRVRTKIMELLHELPHITITTDLWTSDASSSVNDL
ncbi:unnamed protein product [Parnassius apollo]|uniref:(apollo) hypothetical protein n=1 Tax=Parnassius apollo TaxID=110799 RepID=A0A8S3XWJ2_PARAO|nr:unnamed protein product [Parnassius apollo]